MVFTLCHTPPQKLFRPRTFADIEEKFFALPIYRLGTIVAGKFADRPIFRQPPNPRFGAEFSGFRQAPQLANETLWKTTNMPPIKNIDRNAPVPAPTKQNSQTVPFGRRNAPEPPKCLSPSQLQDLFRSIDSRRDEAIFRIMYCKGLRASEIGRLELSNWDDREKMLSIHRLKGSRSAAFAMHDNELRALRAWLKIRGRAPGPLFPSRNHRPISRIRLWVLMHQYCKEAGIPVRLGHPHALKQSRGSHLLEETGKIHVVQDALGHKSIASTMIYAQVSNRDRTEAIALNRSKY